MVTGVAGWIKKIENSVITDVLNSSINLKNELSSKKGMEESISDGFVGSIFDSSEAWYRIS